MSSDAPLADGMRSEQIVGMPAFTTLERTALDAILAEAAGDTAAIEQQLLHSTVRSRQNTGGGFLTYFEADDGTESLGIKTKPCGDNVWIGIEGLEWGMGMILHFKNGRAAFSKAMRSAQKIPPTWTSRTSASRSSQSQGGFR